MSAAPTGGANFAMLKKPSVLIAGALIGLLLLYFMSRNSGAGSSAVDSAKVAGSIDTTLNAQAVQQNIAAYSYQAELAKQGAAKYIADVNSRTALQLHAADAQTNVNDLEANAQMLRDKIAGAITIASGTARSNYELEKLRGDISIRLGPLAADVARSNATIEASKAISLAQISAQTSQQVAAINAASRTSVVQAQGDNATTHDIITGLPALLSALFA